MPAEPLVKVCGVRRGDVADAAIAAGAGALGLNFVAGSRRAVEVDRARILLNDLRRRCERLPLIVGVFADTEVAWIESVRHDLGLDWIQLHGHEPPETVERLSPAYKAVRVGGESDLDSLQTYPGPWVLVDARVTGQLGGTGHQVPATLARRACQLRPVILAGGLHGGNVADAIARARPVGVDSASGCEDREGNPSPEATRRYVTAARDAFAQLQTHAGTPA